MYLVVLLLDDCYVIVITLVLVLLLRFNDLVTLLVGFVGMSLGLDCLCISLGSVCRFWCVWIAPRCLFSCLIGFADYLDLRFNCNASCFEFGFEFTCNLL